MLLAGFSFFGDPFHSHAGWTEANEIGRLWQRLERLAALPSVQNTLFASIAVSYEMHLQNHETPQTGEFEIFAGIEVAAVDNVPLELCVKVVPETDYAVFTVRGSETYGDEPVLDNWLRDNGYRQAFPFFLQRYDARFKGVDHLAESEWDILIPIARVE